jgi:ribosomal protein S18 acetylase RimI-like enzyme
MSLTKALSPSAIKIRHATLDDVPVLISIEEACFDSDRLNLMSFCYMLTKANALLWVIENEAKIFGYCFLLKRRNSTQARIYSIALLPDWVGSGAANILLAHSEQSALQQGCLSIILEVRRDNERAQRFYQRHGYVVFGEYLHYYEDGMSAIRMKKVLHGN